MKGKIFLAVSIVAIVFVLAEIIIQAAGRTICVTEGCELVAQHTRFGNISILLIGLAVFSSLAVLAALSTYAGRTELGKYIDLILVVSLAAEGFFIGYQALRLEVLCFFCLIIFGFIVALGLIRLFQGRKEVIAGFGAFAAVFSLFYLILPAGGPANIPAESGKILFYSDDCAHCKEIMKEMQERSIAASYLSASEYASFLKSVGVAHVPTLFVNTPHEKVFLTGVAAIRNHLFGTRRKPPTETGALPRRPEASGPAAQRLPGAPADAFQPYAVFGPPAIIFSPADGGFCPQEDLTPQGGRALGDGSVDCPPAPPRQP